MTEFLVALLQVWVLGVVMGIGFGCGLFVFRRVLDPTRGEAAREEGADP